MYSKLIFIAVCLVFIVSVNAVPYTSWQSEAVVSADTLGLWSYNSDTIHNVAGQDASYDVVGNSWYRADFISSPASFVSSGKFGGGLNVPFSNAGGISKVEGGWSLWPSNPDPSISVDMWVNFNATDHVLQYLVDQKYSSTGGYTMYLYHDSGMASNVSRLLWSVGDALVATDIEWQVGQWYHLAGTWNATTDTASLYRNGSQLGSATVAGMTLVSSGNDLTIGTRAGSSYWSADAILDDVRFSSVAYDYAVPEPGTISLLSFGVFMAFKRFKRA